MVVLVAQALVLLGAQSLVLRTPAWCIGSVFQARMLPLHSTAQQKHSTAQHSMKHSTAQHSTA
jgi:hypothetical protein